MMAVIGVLLACVGLVVLGLVLGAFAACMLSSQISQVEETLAHNAMAAKEAESRRR